MFLGKSRMTASCIAPVIFACVTGCVLLSAAGASAKTRWLSLQPDKSPGEICITSGDEEFDYYRLDSDSPLEFSVTGPREVKILTRYVFEPGDPDVAGYTVRVIRDGVLLMRRALSTGRSEAYSSCGERGRPAGIIRRILLDVPKGAHTYQVFLVESDRRVAARVFRRVLVRQSSTVSFTPSTYVSICTLQFSSGSLSEYYGFDQDHPLAFRLVGPTKIKVCTRLEFDPSMNGSQSYGIEVLEDGAGIKDYHYHVRKMETVCYLEHPDVLPGERKCFHIRVPKGPHDYEIRISNGPRRRGAAKIHIPKSDLRP